ncbi:MAG TPA: hypothetical protein VGN80_17685 [Devosiaceae bacterium]|jgi:hypothetical protein|nr:hypothetical protein [Devosiaceae bacterium]
MLALSPDQTRAANESCACTSLDRQILGASLRSHDCPSLEQLPQTHPHLFSDAPVFVARAEMAAMQELVTVIEGVVASPPYQDLVLARSPAIAASDFGPRGAFMGYDFHLSAEGPRLIEINTNAGGAFLNGIACEAQRLCCPEMARYGTNACPQDLSARVAAMFREEWRLQRGNGAPALIAIVDDTPEDQYLHPEFLLAQSLLTAQGLPAVVADPQDLEHHHGRLWLGDRPVDLVYNRLVDFDLSEPRHRALRDAYVAGEVVVTPSPRHHALLADKRNLVTLSDPVALQALEVGESQRAALAAIPQTQAVTAANAEALWAARNGLFFKPIAGHGGKAVYRGDKLTRKVWATIPDGGYVAQQRIAPSERVVRVGDERQRHKVDVRLYTYGGQLLLAAARIYQGQTTNFRTPGGGFAPVMVA